MVGLGCCNYGRYDWPYRNTHGKALAPSPSTRRQVALVRASYLQIDTYTVLRRFDVGGRPQIAVFPMDHPSGWSLGKRKG